jgi:hypothetical protein
MPVSAGIMFLMYKLVVLVYIRQPCGIRAAESKRKAGRFLGGG